VSIAIYTQSTHHEGLFQDFNALHGVYNHHSGLIMDLIMAIGENIKRLRRDKGLTQGQLADKSKLGLNLISRLERNATDPKLSSLDKLMNALECSADALISDEENSGLPTLLKTQVERITVLPAEDQKVIIKMIDNYSKAVAYDNIMKDRGFFSMQPIMGKTESVLK